MHAALRAAFFALGALVIHLVLSATYVSTAGRAHRAVELDELFLSSKRPLDLLVVGGSHARNAIDGEALPNTLNIAVGGEHPVKSYHRLKWLLAHEQRKVRAVALSYDITSFSPFKSDHYAPEYVWGRYIDFWELGLRKSQPSAYAGRALKARVAPYAGEVETLFQFVAGTRAFRDERSILRFGDQSEELQQRLAAETARRHFAGESLVDPSKRWAFLSMIHLLESLDIRIVLVSYPLTRAYHDEVAALGAYEARRVEVADRLELNVVSSVGEGARDEFRQMRDAGLDAQGILHLDYSDLLHDTDNLLFLDADHLNWQGQQAFTQLMRAQLRRRGFWHRLRKAGPPG